MSAPLFGNVVSRDVFPQAERMLTHFFFSASSRKTERMVSAEIPASKKHRGWNKLQFGHIYHKPSAFCTLKEPESSAQSSETITYLFIIIVSSAVRYSIILNIKLIFKV